METIRYKGYSIYQKKEIIGELITTSDSLCYIVPQEELYLDINGNIKCDNCLDIYEVDKDTIKII